MQNINIFNLEEIILSNQSIQEYLRIEKKTIYDEWRTCLFTNNKSCKSKFFIKFLEQLIDNDFKKSIEKILGCDITVDLFNTKIVDHFDINKEALYNVVSDNRATDFANLVLYRKGDNIKITVWR